MTPDPWVSVRRVRDRLTVLVVEARGLDPDLLELYAAQLRLTARQLRAARKEDDHG